MSDELTRKEFIRLGAAATVALTLPACSADDEGDGGASAEDGPADTGAGCDGGASGVISGNHGHELIVPNADLVAGAGATYGIQGTSPHTHDVTLTADQMAQIADGMSVTVTSSSGGGHTHQVTIAC
jgi:hypothetical protein